MLHNIHTYRSSKISLKQAYKISKETDALVADTWQYITLIRIHVAITTHSKRTIFKVDAGSKRYLLIFLKT